MPLLTTPPMLSTDDSHQSLHHTGTLTRSIRHYLRTPNLAQTAVSRKFLQSKASNDAFRPYFCRNMVVLFYFWDSERGLGRRLPPPPLDPQLLFRQRHTAVTVPFVSNQLLLYAFAVTAYLISNQLLLYTFADHTPLLSTDDQRLSARRVVR